MKLAEYAALDATALAAAIAARELEAGEVAEVALRAVEAVEPALNAVVGGPYEDAAPAGDGPLAGVPFAAKDTLMQAGRPLGFGSALLEGFVASADSTLSERFRAAGLVTIARTATPEFAFNFDTAPRVHGPTRNPWDRSRSPGGSSGGSAALVAAGAVPLAHANDGGGSIRIPAAFCGLVGLKPSRGRVPIGPAVGEAVGGFAHEFAVTRTVRDAALLLDTIAGPAPGDRYYVQPPAKPFTDAVARRPRGLRVAVHADSWDSVPVAPAAVAAVEHVADTLEELGHHVARAVPRVDADALRQACEVIWSVDLAGLAFAFAQMTRRRDIDDLVEAASLSCIRRGQEATALELASAQAFVNATSRRWGRFLDEHDVFLCPTAAIAAPPSGSPAQDDARFETASQWIDELFTRIPFTPVANMTGQPSISLPLGMDANGLPVGVMLTAQTLREDLLFELAAQLEEALPWAVRRPAVFAGA